MAESDIENVASQKYGGVPLWAWGAGVAVLIVGYMYWRNRSASANATTAVVTPQPTDATGTGSLDTSGGYIPQSPYMSGGQPIPAATNSEWLSNAEQALLTSGHSPTDILNSLQKWLTGGTLTATDQGIVNAAINAEGLPPDTTGIAAQGTPAQSPTPSGAIHITQGGGTPRVGGTFTMLVSWSGFPTGTTALYATVNSAIEDTFYVSTPVGAKSVSFPMNWAGTVQVRVQDASANIVSNTLMMNVAAATPSNPKVTKQ